MRWVSGTLSGGLLVALFVFQETNWASFVFGVENRQANFFINRSIRFLLNDTLALSLIWALFNERKYLIFAFIVQLVGFATLLLPYFLLKWYLPSYNGPLINFLHRIVLNPTLLLLLIPAFYYQKNIAPR